MDAPPAFGFKELFNHVIGDMAKALCQRNGESEQTRYARCQAAVQMIMGFMPRDVIEAMLAGHCVMFHELIVDSARHTLLGEIDRTRRATRGGIVAMDKCFAANLERLGHYQLRPSTGRRDVAGIEVGDAVADFAGEENRDASPELASEAEFHAAQMMAAGDATNAPANDPLVDNATSPLTAGCQGEAVQVELRTDAAAPAQPGTLVFTPSAAVIAACKANPEAMAALEAGDPERFARAMGLEQPSEAFLAAAAAPGSPFQADFAPGRDAGPRYPARPTANETAGDRTRKSGSTGSRSG